MKKKIEAVSDYKISFKKIQKIQSINEKESPKVKKWLNFLLEKQYSINSFNKYNKDFLLSLKKMNYYKILNFYIYKSKKIKQFYEEYFRCVNNINDYFSFDDFISADLFELKSILDKIDIEIKKYSLENKLPNKKIIWKVNSLYSELDSCFEMLRDGDHAYLKNKILKFCRELETLSELVPLLYISNEYSSITKDSLHDWLFKNANNYLRDNQRNIVENRNNYFNNQIKNYIENLKSHELQTTIKNYYFSYKELINTKRLNDFTFKNCKESYDEIQKIYDNVSKHYNNIIGLINNNFKSLIPKHVVNNIFSDLNKLDEELRKKYKSIKKINTSTNGDKEVLIHTNTEKNIFSFLEINNIFTDKLVEVYRYIQKIRKYDLLIPKYLYELSARNLWITNFAIKNNFNVKTILNDTINWNTLINKIHDLSFKNSENRESIFKQIVIMNNDLMKVYSECINYLNWIKSLDKKILHWNNKINDFYINQSVKNIIFEANKKFNNSMYKSSEKLLDQAKKLL